MEHTNFVCDSDLSFLDLRIRISKNRAHWTIYDKRRDFKFRVIRFPHFSTNLSFKVHRGVYYSQFRRYKSVIEKPWEFPSQLAILNSQFRDRGFSNVIIDAFQRFAERKFANSTTSNSNLRIVDARRIYFLQFPPYLAFSCFNKICCTSVFRFIAHALVLFEIKALYLTLQQNLLYVYVSGFACGFEFSFIIQIPQLSGGGD